MLAEINLTVLWLVVGFTAQAVIVGCLVAHLVLSRRSGTFVLSSTMVIVCLCATAALAIYAAFKHDAVFLAGQFVNLAIGLRVLGLRYEATRSGGEVFPMVAPDAADGVGSDAGAPEPPKRS